MTSTHEIACILIESRIRLARLARTLARVDAYLRERSHDRD